MRTHFSMRINNANDLIYSVPPATIPDNLPYALPGPPQVGFLPLPFGGDIYDPLADPPRLTQPTVLTGFSWSVGFARYWLQGSSSLDWEGTDPATEIYFIPLVPVYLRVAIGATRMRKSILDGVYDNNWPVANPADPNRLQWTPFNPAVNPPDNLSSGIEAAGKILQRFPSSQTHPEGFLAGHYLVDRLWPQPTLTTSAYTEKIGPIQYAYAPDNQGSWAFELNLGEAQLPVVGGLNKQLTSIGEITWYNRQPAENNLGPDDSWADMQLMSGMNIRNRHWLQMPNHGAMQRVMIPLGMDSVISCQWQPPASAIVLSDQADPQPFKPNVFSQFQGHFTIELEYLQAPTWNDLAPFMGTAR